MDVSPKIALPIFACGTGNDVYFQRLALGLRTAGVRADILPLPWWCEFLPGLPYRFRRALRGYDLIHTNADWGSCFFLPGKPLLVTFHHSVLSRSYSAYTSVSQRLYHRGLLRARLRRAANLAQTIFCPSRATYDAFSEILPNAVHKLRHLPHGLDLHTFRPSTSCQRKRNALLSVGTISRRKGTTLFPALMDVLGPEFRLQYIGQGNGSRLRHSRIQWRQAVSGEELISLYRTCAVYVSLSRLEGFGYAVAEAMSCAAPVVATAASSLPELIGDSALQICRLDDVNDCAARIQMICGNQELGRSLGCRNRKRAEERFVMEPIIAAYLEVYRQALG